MSATTDKILESLKTLSLLEASELVKQIDRALYNPIWEQVRKPAPWDEPEAAPAWRTA